MQGASPSSINPSSSVSAGHKSAIDADGRKSLPSRFDPDRSFYSIIRPASNYRRSIRA